MAISPTFVLGATGAGLALVLGVLAYVHPHWAAAAAVAAVLLTAAAYVRMLGWTTGLVVLLIVTSLIDRYTFPVGRIDIRAEQIAVLLATAVFVVDRVRRRNFAWLRPTWGESALLAWFAVGLVSSIFEAPSRGQSLKILALLVLSSLAAVLPPRLIERDRNLLDQVVRWFLLAVALESTYAVLAYLLHIVGPSISLSVNPASGHVAAYGTMWEPNVLGAVCGAGAVAWAYLGRQHFRQAWLGIAICLLATVVSYTRAAWLAVIAVLILSLVLPLRRRIHFPSILLAGAAILVAAPVVFSVDKVGKFSSAGGVAGAVANQTDVLGRLYQFRTAIAELRNSPILGGGIDSYGERHVLAGTPEHLANVGLAIVNDTGILGLVVFAAFVLAIVLAAWRCHRDATVLALAAMMLVIAITNQATETLELMITWLLIGLLLAAIRAAAPVSGLKTAHTARDTGS